MKQETDDKKASKVFFFILNEIILFSYKLIYFAFAEIKFKIGDN